MSGTSPYTTDQNALVPTRVPALVISRTSGGPWQVDQITPALAEAVTGSEDGGIGRTVTSLFDQASPPLHQLADQCLSSGKALDRPIQLLPELPLLTAELRLQGLSDDYQRHRLGIWFSEADLPQGSDERFHDLVGISPSMQNLFHKIRLYGRSDAAVVITGETGTGKELVARALHEESDRRSGPYVAINCSAISDELLESELFGHEKGAFTGAVRAHKGRFERAHGGTLFLDEVGDMPTHTQTKLLRVLEEGVIERVGAEVEQPVDVRVVCATNVTLEQAVRDGRFRSDLYHRLAVLRLHLPPLRERTEDISLLVAHFLELFGQRYNRQVQRLTPEALSLLASYQWPGNIRELRNVLERVLVETQGEAIGARAFAEWVRERQSFAPGDWSRDQAESQTRESSPIVTPYHPGGQRLLAAPTEAIDVEPLSGRRGVPANLDQHTIRQAYQAAAGNLTQAAKRLGVHRATLYRHLQKLGLSRTDLDR